MRERPMMAAIVSVVLGMLLVMAPAASAQGGGSQVVATGETITWGAEWQLDPELSLNVEGYDQLVLWRDNARISVGGANLQVTGPQLRDILATELIEVDRGDYDNVSYSLDLYPSDSGIQAASFMLIVEREDSTSVAVLLSERSQFQGNMEAAQAGIGIDDEQLFTGIDAAAMQQQIDAAAGTTSQPVNPTPMSTGTNNTQTTATNENRLLSTSVELPSSGVQIAATEDWVINYQDDRRLELVSVGQPLVSFGVADAGDVPSGLNAAAMAPAALINWWMYPGVELVDAIDVDANRKIIVVRYEDATGALYGIYEIGIGPEISTWMLLAAYKEDLGAGIDLVSSTVQVNGQPAFADLDQVAPAIFPGGGT